MDHSIKYVMTSVFSLIVAALLFFVSDAILEHHWMMLTVLCGVGVIYLCYRVAKKYMGSIFPLPSTLILIISLLAPFIGIHGFKVFVDIHGNYMGLRHMDFSVPLLVWYFGLFSFSAGIYLGHLQNRKEKTSVTYVWDMKRLKSFLAITTLIAFFCSILAFVSIGYIPIVRGNIEQERFSYGGGAFIKYSRLWLVSVMLIANISSVEKLTKKYISLIVVALFGLVAYGQRLYFFLGLAYLWLYYLKLKQRISMQQIIITIIILFAGVFSVNFLRGEWGNGQRAILDGLFLSAFGEWREYSYLVNKLASSHASLAFDQMYLGPLAALLPKEIWAIFDLNKEAMLQNNAAVFLGNYLHRFAGIRIGIIGELFAVFKYYGTLIGMVMMGFIFGVAEKVFIRSKTSDPALMFTCLCLSILVLTPIITFINISSLLVFYGFCSMITILFCRRKLPQ